MTATQQRERERERKLKKAATEECETPLNIGIETGAHEKLQELTGIILRRATMVMKFACACLMAVAQTMVVKVMMAIRVLLQLMMNDDNNDENYNTAVTVAIVIYKTTGP